MGGQCLRARPQRPCKDLRLARPNGGSRSSVACNVLERSQPSAAAEYRTRTSDRRLSSANFPTDDDGRTYHVGTKGGEVSSRILGVGSLGRARLLGELLEPLDGQSELCAVESSRGFLTITGQWRGTPVSIVTHLMGFGNLDLFLRETRAVTEPPLLVIRIGTCGSLNHRVGQLHIPSRGSVAVIRNPDAFHPEALRNGATTLEPYLVTLPVQPDDALCAALHRESEALLGPDGVHLGMNASADSFFSSQGREDPNFFDNNQHVLPMLLERHPEVSSLEMESFHLFHLAQCSYGTVRAAAGALSLACRLSNKWIDVSLVNDLEMKAGQAALNALVSTELDHAQPVSIHNSYKIWAD